MKKAELETTLGATGFRRGTLVALAIVSLVGCGDTGTVVPTGTGAFGGAGAAAGNGTGGMSGMNGTGGTGGVGAMVGTGGAGGSGSGIGAGGTAGELGECATNALCHTCPDQFLCESDDDCTFSGYVCVASGCDTHGGAPIKQCQPSRGGSCVDDGDCPNAVDYDCMTVGAGGKRCVRAAAGCDPATESYDCPLGFSCEGATCVDRRLACDSYLDCPKSHICRTTPTTDFCVRVYRTCHVDEDCAGFGSACVDIDGDSTKECAGELEGIACVNASCSGPTPVCEAGSSGTTAACGDYGLCRTNGDCDVAGGFECVGLWQDGRKECVRTGGACSQVTSCPLHQVCAVPRSGGPPSCQAGSAP